jgi:hypothetical protein
MCWDWDETGIPPGGIALCRRDELGSPGHWRNANVFPWSAGMLWRIFCIFRSLLTKIRIQKYGWEKDFWNSLIESWGTKNQLPRLVPFRDSQEDILRILQDSHDKWHEIKTTVMRKNTSLYWAHTEEAKEIVEGNSGKFSHRNFLSNLK